MIRKIKGSLSVFYNARVNIEFNSDFRFSKTHPFKLCACSGMSSSVTNGLVKVSSPKHSSDATPLAANSMIPNVVVVIKQ